MTDHVHHWKLESPNGETSIGECACGAQREFHNSIATGRIEPSTWNGGVSAAEQARRRKWDEQHAAVPQR